MTTITADDIRVLAQSNEVDPALALIDGTVQVVESAQAAEGHLVYTKQDLVAEYGDEITDVQAEVLAAGLTAQLVDTSGVDTPGVDSPDVDSPDVDGAVV